jgi:hypothetical protein
MFNVELYLLAPKIFVWNGRWTFNNVNVVFVACRIFAVCALRGGGLKIVKMTYGDALKMAFLVIMWWFIEYIFFVVIYCWNNEFHSHVLTVLYCMILYSCVFHAKHKTRTLHCLGSLFHDTIHALYSSNTCSRHCCIVNLKLGWDFARYSVF